MPQWKEHFTHIPREWISEWKKGGETGLKGNEMQGAKGIVISS